MLGDRVWDQDGFLDRDLSLRKSARICPKEQLFVWSFLEVLAASWCVGGSMDESGIKLDKRGIRAVIRIRPKKPEEEAYITAEPHYGKKMELEGRSYTDTFSMVLGPESTQHEVFRAVGLPCAEATLRGQNTCLFAYGQSGAGKTFSMYGAEGGKVPSRLDGVVPAICAELFRRKQDVERRGDYKLKLDVMIVEVKGAMINDLLAEPLDGVQPQLKLRGNVIEGNVWEQIFSSRGLTQTIERAMLRRATGKNYFNSSSSRSHCFLTMRLSKVRRSTGRPRQGSCRIACLHVAHSNAYDSPRWTPCRCR